MTQNNFVDDALAKVYELGTAGAMKWLHDQLVRSDYVRCIVLDDLKYRLSLADGDEARIGAAEFISELGYAKKQPITGYELVTPLGVSLFYKDFEEVKRFINKELYPTHELHLIRRI